MRVECNLDDLGTMLAKRGLEPGGRVQKLFTGLCRDAMIPYVPMQQGVLSDDMALIEEDGVLYNTPYAHYHYVGKVRVGRAPKTLTDVDLKHHGAPMRGPFWDKRMWKDRKQRILNVVARAAGGKAE